MPGSVLTYKSVTVHRQYPARRFWPFLCIAKRVTGNGVYSNINPGAAPDSARQTPCNFLLILLKLKITE
ncbi:hypothetical protein CLOSTASPAR_05627 [[Clostridium] asparagiforme DSM 15981]|uniref:Uncharacterized protein n=1 Tax=[Clostridium] asparagiforme DSM 15981 TaxID=518636 RepID=C0D8M8_9FIRM|nr:hypothetical protein CLOSTASPAR_05627 [[Clostridium] asparagiforme DSM 15981]